MKCPKCKANNKPETKYCKRCGSLLHRDWQPSWKWSIKVLAVIYIVLILVYVFLRVFL